MCKFFYILSRGTADPSGDEYGIILVVGGLCKTGQSCNSFIGITPMTAAFGTSWLRKRRGWRRWALRPCGCLRPAKVPMAAIPWDTISMILMIWVYSIRKILGVLNTVRWRR